MFAIINDPMKSSYPDILATDISSLDLLDIKLKCLQPVTRRRPLRRQHILRRQKRISLTLRGLF